MKYTTVFIAFFLLIGAISAVPTHHNSERTTTCTKKCLNHENNLFNEIGSTHHFNYETESEIELENGQKTHVNLKAKVDISTISKCEHQMHLRKVQINGPKEAEIMKEQLERHSTRFSQDNSRIESICHDESEETWVLNLKKAILSTMQVTVREQTEQVVEKDVLGFCNTKYEQISSNTLQKSKFLNTCTRRSQSINSILTGDFNKEKRSICKIELDNEKQQLKSVTCEETNSLLPFAQSKASGSVTTVTRMNLEKIDQTLPQVSHKQMIRDSLQFNKRHFNKNYDQDLKKIAQTAEQILDEIRSDVQNNVQKETPEKIRKLSQYLAQLNVKELERLSQKVSSQNDKVKDIFFDTVAQTGTEETAHIILKVILDRQFYQTEVSKVRKAFWLSMLSNVDQVSDEILSITLEHIKNDNLPRQAMFALTSMIHEIKDDEEIKQDSRYQQVVNALIEKLNKQTDEKEKIAVLKALRNTGISHQNFDQIFKVAQQSRNIETRIAAIQALEQHVQEERFFKKLMKIFENNSNEAEVRIAAFQVLVNNQKRVHELNKVLETESNKQVGSYVVSYFKNARDNQLPEFETLRRIASTFDLPEKKFERSDLRQSKHIQFTQQIERLDLGAQVEADLVFDEQKQLRNVRARFDLNKENLQMKSVEITLRQTGLPEVAQQMVQELTRQTNLDSIVDEIQQFTSIRSRHQLNQKINRLVQLLNLNNINMNDRRWTEKMDASIHIRVEDKTVMYLSLKDVQEYSSTLQQSYQREQILDQITDHLTGDNAITLILRNKQHRMPTAHGLPVHTGQSLVIVAALRTENGAFYPSIATDLQWEMGFTIMHVRPAIQYHLQMHSAPGLKMNVERKNGVPTKLQISMPENRLEIISVRSVVKLQTAENKEIELNVSKKERTGCTRIFNHFLGVELCQKIVTPRNFFEKDAWNVLFNGPIELSLNLEKTDSSIKYWEMIFETQLGQRSGEPKALHVAFNTVGSRKNRELSAKIELQNERDSKIVHIDLRTPVKSAKIEARIQMTQEKLGGKVALMMDNQRFEAEIGVDKTMQNDEHHYKPSFKLTVPGMKKISYAGRISFVNSGKKENFQIELRDTISNKVMLKATAIKSGKIDVRENFKFTTDLQGYWITGSSIRFVSNIDKNSNGLTVDFETIHSVERQAPTTYKWKVALKDLSNNDVSKYNADFELNLPNTEFQNIAFSYNFVKRIEGEIESELTGFWNNHNGQKTRQVHILQQLKMNKASAKISSLWENLLKIEILPLSVHYEVQAKTNWQRSQQKYNVQLTTRDVRTNKQYKGEMKYFISENKPFKMNLEAKVMIENNEFEIKHSIEEQESHQYHGRAMVQLRKDQKIEANYVYRMKEHSLQIPRLNHELEAEIRIPSKSITIKHKSGLKMNANQFELKHSLRKNNAVLSDVKILLNKNGQSQLLLDNQLFQVKVDCDVTKQSNKQVNILFNGKNHQLYHQSKLQWSGKQQFQIESKTTKNEKHLAEVSIDYQKSQKAEAKIQIEKLGELLVSHQPNGQQWGTIEIKSDFFSRPIRQKLVVEKSSNKFTIRSKTQQNQEVVGELEFGSSSSSLKVSAFDWKLNGKTANREMVTLSWENSRMNMREELELHYKNKVAKISFKHLNNKRTTTIDAQLSTVQESRLQIDNEHINADLSMKPTGQEKHVKLAVNCKNRNIQHKSELRIEESTLTFALEHTKDNQNIVQHNTKLSMNDDSHTKTETKKFTVEVNYRRHSALEIKFDHENGLKHLTNFEITDLRNKIGKISSSTTKNGQQWVNLKVDVNSIRKINIKLAGQDKEAKLNINLKGQQKQIDLVARNERMEIRSNWNKESHKEQKYTLEVEDKKHDSKYNLLAHHQRKTMLNIKIESSRNGKTQSGELKLHKDGEAFFRLDSKDLKMKTELNFKQSPVEASFKFDSRKYSINHQTTLTFLKQENELKIKSKTDKKSRQIANIDFSFNPTTKQIFASGEVDNKNLKIEGNVNNRYLIELKSENNQFKHLTELDLNTKTLRSETLKNGVQLHKIEARMVRKYDVDGSINVMEQHELIFKSNSANNKYQLDYNNKRTGLKSTGHYTINGKIINAKINAQQKSKNLVDLEANLNMNERSLNGKMSILKTKSSVQIKLQSNKKVRATIEFENQEQNQQFSFKIDSTNQSEKHLSTKLRTESLNLENEIKLIKDQEFRFEGQAERNGQKLVQANIKIAKPFNLDGKVHFNTKNFNGHAKLETLNGNEMRIEFLTKDSQARKMVDLKSKLIKETNKLTLKIDFDGQKVNQYTLTSELKKESNELKMTTLLKSKDQKIGRLDASIKKDGSELDAKLNGELNVNGQKSEIEYKLNNLNNRFEHVFKVQNNNKNSLGFEISAHSRQGRFIIHLPNRVVELRYDVSSQSNGHVLVNLQILPNSVHQPNNMYSVTLDNLVSMNHQELIVNTKALVHHPEIHHPVEMVFRGELRELHHQRPLVVFVSYDASQNQQNRNSVLFEISNENNLRVAHFNISHQNQPILDVHYRWAVNYHLIHQQLTWSILKQYNQKATGELLGQINLRQRQAKIELNNNHKLQIKWENNFDQNTIVQIRAQTDNLVRKMKIMTNYKNKQIEITTFENEKMQSNYIVSVLKEKNTLLAIEMSKKQGNKLEKIAFIQLVKDSLNYAKVHLKVEKSLVYEIESSMDQIKNKVRSSARRHAQEISSIARQQYENLKLKEQTENTVKLIKKLKEDLDDIVGDYARSLQQYLPKFFEGLNYVYQKFAQYLREVHQFNLEQRIAEFIGEIIERLQRTQERAQEQWDSLVKIIEDKSETISEQYREVSKRFNYDVIVKLSNQIEKIINEFISLTEEESERVYEFLHKNLKSVKLERIVESIRSIIVNIRNQIKRQQLSSNLHKLVYNMQETFEGKFNLKGEGEIIAKIYFPTRIMNKLTN